jgi:diacylglycerol O-acyltransferase-1
MQRSTSNLEKEIKYLTSQLSGLQILLTQNQELEEQVNRLVEELDNATQAVVKRGYLYKWREKEFAWATRWGLRYFSLQGSSLSYYGEESEKRPKRTIDLSRCVVRNEGTKKNGTFHVFSIYLVNNKEEDDDDDATHLSLLLRLSSESEAEALQWIDMLEQGCAVEEMKSMPSAMFRRLSNDYSDDPNFGRPTPAAALGTDPTFDDAPVELETSLTDADMSPVMLERVQSASESLKRVASRQTLARRVLAKRSPRTFSSSGTRLDHLVDNTVVANTAANSTTGVGVSKVGDDNNTSTSFSGLRQRKTGVGDSDSLKVDTEASSASSSSSSSGPDSRGKKTFKIKRSFPASKPMHVMAGASALSSGQQSGAINYRGFFNLAIIILLILNARIIIDSHKKYGFVPAWQDMIAKWTSSSVEHTPIEQWGSLLTSAGGISVLSWLLQLLVSYALETLYETESVPERVAVFINTIWCSFLLFGPTYWVWYSEYPHAGARMTYLFQSVVMWMKLISYHHASRDLRVTRRSMQTNVLTRRGSRDTLKVDFDDNMKPQQQPSAERELAFLQEVRDIKPPFLRYPENLTLPNLLYFSVAPTLTYQLNYPKANGTRWSIVLTILFRMMVVSGLILFATESYIMPTVQNSMEAMHSMNVMSIMERVLKLSIPNSYVWLLVFYFYFHLWLNLLAELTNFGDRVFYKDWWNSRTIDSYWRNWNIPVHNWILRHLYYPALRMGLGKVAGTFIAFFFSAALHEVILSVPFRCLSMHAFAGMIGQAPLSWFTKMIDKRFDNAFLGNVIFWMAFCVVGQPLGILLTSYDRWRMEGGGGDVVV